MDYDMFLCWLTKSHEIGAIHHLFSATREIAANAIPDEIESIELFKRTKWEDSTFRPPRTQMWRFNDSSRSDKRNCTKSNRIHIQAINVFEILQSEAHAVMILDTEVYITRIPGQDFLNAFKRHTIEITKVRKTGHGHPYYPCLSLLREDTNWQFVSIHFSLSQRWARKRVKLFMCIIITSKRCSCDRVGKLCMAWKSLRTNKYFGYLCNGWNGPVLTPACRFLIVFWLQWRLKTRLIIPAEWKTTVFIFSKRHFEDAFGFTSAEGIAFSCCIPAFGNGEFESHDCRLKHPFDVNPD